ncbi:MAG: hypothetical protein CBB60_000450, partial [Armatimonadetes bacterium Cent15-Ar3]
NRPVLIVIRLVAFATWLLMCGGAPARFVLVACWVSNILMLCAVLAGFWFDFRDGKPFKWIYLLALALFYLISIMACPVLMAAAPRWA